MASSQKLERRIQELERSIAESGNKAQEWQQEKMASYRALEDFRAKSDTNNRLIQSDMDTHTSDIVSSIVMKLFDLDVNLLYSRLYNT
jgi:hypothetical protein